MTTPVSTPGSGEGKLSKSKQKPAKPRKNYPLFAHQNGQWAKKIKGKLHYFGKWNDPEGAEAKYLDERDHLQAGRLPPSRTGVGGCRVADLCNKFMAAKDLKRDTGEITEATFQDYLRAAKRVTAAFGRDTPVESLTPDDFSRFRKSLNKTLGLVSQGNEINRIRIIFKFAFDEGLIEKPVRFGSAFIRPSAKSIRKKRNIKNETDGPKMFEAEEIRAIIDAAPDPMRAFVFLAINCAFGPTDISELPRKTVQVLLTDGWLEYPRRKTAAPRRIHLWAQTREAVATGLAVRHHEQLAFVTRVGRPYVRQEGGTRRDSLGEQFRLLLGDLGLKRPGRGFYALRHTFATVAGETRDQRAVDAIMGHVTGSMSENYVQCIEDDRLRAVTDHVLVWLDLKS